MFSKVTKLISGKAAAKAATWRVTASSETMLLGWLMTGSIKVGMSIASVEVFTKFVLYYAHEMAWTEVPAWLAKWAGVKPVAA